MTAPAGGPGVETCKGGQFAISSYLFLCEFAGTLCVFKTTYIIIPMSQTVKRFKNIDFSLVPCNNSRMTRKKTERLNLNIEADLLYRIRAVSMLLNRPMVAIVEDYFQTFYDGQPARIKALTEEIVKEAKKHPAPDR